MRAWLLDSQTGLDALRLADDVEVPAPAPGQIRLRVQLAALNPADRYLAEKLYPGKPTFPHILGREAYGVVDALGDGVSGWEIGEHAIILRGEAGVNTRGTLAEFVCVPAGLVARVPHGWTPEQAAGAPVVALTAYQALTMWESLGVGATVVVSGASGGVGVATIQLGSGMGLRVIGLSRSAIKAEALKREGAIAVFDPADENLVKKIRDEAGAARVALAVDNIGGELFPRLIETLGNNGRVSCVGRLAGPVPSFNTATLFFRRLRVGGVAVGAYTEAEARAAWDAVVKLYAQAQRHPLVDHVFAMNDLRAAFDRLAAGPLGKVLVRVAG